MDSVEIKGYMHLYLERMCWREDLTLKYVNEYLMNLNHSA